MNDQEEQSGDIPITLYGGGKIAFRPGWGILNGTKIYDVPHRSSSFTFEYDSGYMTINRLNPDNTFRIEVSGTLIKIRCLTTPNWFIRTLKRFKRWFKNLINYKDSAIIIENYLLEWNITKPNDSKKTI